MMLQDGNILVYRSADWTQLQITRRHLQKLLEPVSPHQCCILRLELRNEAVNSVSTTTEGRYLPIFWLIEALSYEVEKLIQQVVLEEHTLVYCELQDSFSRHCLLEQGRRVLYIIEAEHVRKMEHTPLVRRLGWKRWQLSFRFPSFRLHFRLPVLLPFCFWTLYRYLF